MLLNFGKLGIRFRVSIFSSLNSKQCFGLKISPDLHSHFQSLTIAAAAPAAAPPPLTPVNETHLVRVCTILYQQQNSPDSKLRTNLTKTQFNLTHEFYLQVCNKFPISWRPIYKFHQFAASRPDFAHTATTFNKTLDVVGKSRNLDLFWALCREAGECRLVNVKTYIIAMRTLAASRQLKKCVEFFHLMKGFGYEYKVEIFNTVVEILCKKKLVNEARHVVVKLKDWITADNETYRWLIYGFCDVGDLVEASKLWNLMVDEEGLEPCSNVVEVMLKTLFKNNRFDDGLKLFQSMRVRRVESLRSSTYKVVIEWLCKKGRMGEVYVVFEEMKSNGIMADNETLGWIVYGLMSRGRVKEAYRVYGECVERNGGDLALCVYHGMIKGLLRAKRAREATEVFREMVRRGCEPTMHTYVMLLQGHLGRRERRGEDPLVNFDSIFVGGLIKAGKSLEAGKYVERVIDRGVKVPRFDYNNFLHCFSNEKGAVMFETMAGKLREVGLFDLGDIFARYGQKMVTRERRNRRNNYNQSVEEELSVSPPQHDSLRE